MKLFFRSIGRGTPLVVLHGLYGQSDNWVSIARELADRYEVFLVDQRNHGHSPHHPEHNYELMRADLLEFFDDRHLTKAILLGHSMGGKTAMYFAAQHPERVQALVVVDIAPKSYVGLPGYRAQTIDHQQIVAAMQAIDFEAVASRADADEQLARRIASAPVRQFLLKNLRRHPDNSFSWGLNVEAIARNLPQILGGLLPEDFQLADAAAIPTLFVRGEQSNYILPDDLELIQRLFPAAQLVSIPQAGHWVHAEQPALLLKNLRYFLGE